MKKDDEISTRLRNSLSEVGYKHFTELTGKDIVEVLRIRNLGKKSAKELDIALRYRGLEGLRYSCSKCGRKFK